MKKLPYGQTDFKKIIEENYYYVDKTKYIEELENTKDVLLYLRPRRFGKTLFTSMISYYYDVNAKDLFDSLFKDTYIHNNPTPNKNKYYIFKLDFSNININTKIDDIITIENKFSNKVRDSIVSFNNRYRFNINTYEELTDSSEVLRKFIQQFESLHLDNKLYVIIDEYDNFTNSILGKSRDLFKDILGQDGFVKNFYSVLKEKRDIIDRIFITGVCSISLD